MTTLDLDALDGELMPLIDRFDRVGHRLFMVGGVVRDLVVLAQSGAPVNVGYDADIDATTSAPPEVIKECLAGWADAVWTQGERFGTIAAMKRQRVGDVVVERSYEITTHRAEAYHEGSRKPEVSFATEISADLSRRDFTINAMALELTGGADRRLMRELAVIDPFHGADDLARRILRTPIAPTQSFSDDPLRMFRAARFLARYDLAPADGLEDAVVALVGRLSIVSHERIRDELHKLLAVSMPDRGLRFCAATGVLGAVIPELADEARARTAIDACSAVALRKDDGSRLMRLAALVAEVEDPARALRRLRHSTDDVRAVTTIVDGSWSLRELATADQPPTDSELRRAAVACGPLLNEAVTVAAARSSALDGLGDVLDRVVRLAAIEDLPSFGPVLDGAAVMRLLGVSSGPVVGAALAHLREVQLDVGPITVTAAEADLLEWWRERAERVTLIPSIEGTATAPSSDRGGITATRGRHHDDVDVG